MICKHKYSHPFASQDNFTSCSTFAKKLILLLSFNPTINSLIIHLNLRFIFPKITHFISAKLWNAVQQCDVDLVRKYLAKEGVNVNWCKFTPDKYTPLHVAASKGINLSQLLLIFFLRFPFNSSRTSQFWCRFERSRCHRGTKINYRLNLPKTTPLHVACSCGNTEVCRVLIEAGANVNYVCLTKSSPLYVAAWYEIPGRYL